MVLSSAYINVPHLSKQFIYRQKKFATLNDLSLIKCSIQASLLFVACTRNKSPNMESCNQNCHTTSHQRPSRYLDKSLVLRRVS